MFLLTRFRDAGFQAVEKMRRCFSDFSPGPIVELPWHSRTLLWARCQPRDNLHVFSDGIVAGKLRAEEPDSPEPQRHDGPLPEWDTIAASVVFRQSGRVEARGAAHVYHADGALSDRQLLLAGAANLRPSPELFAILAAAGSFPGNLTLFEGVRKVDYLNAYDLQRDAETPHLQLDLAEPDDEYIVERLKKLVPDSPHAALGVSGGYDSRFILGLLLSRGVRPRLLHLRSAEEDVVRAMAAAYNLELEIFEPAPMLPAGLYTVMSDAQLPYRGGMYNRMRERLRPGELYYTGLYASPLIKTGLRTAWKIPGLRSQMFERLIRYGLLPHVPERLPQLRGSNTREAIAAAVTAELEPWRAFCAAHPRHVSANWFDLYNVNVRWAVAHTADLEFFVQHIPLMHDFEALRRGLRSGAWENYRKDRIRAINRKLHPKLEAPYADGFPAAPESGLANAIGKLRYEYLDRAFTRFRAAPRPSAAPPRNNLAQEAAIIEPDLLADYLTEPAPALIASSAPAGLRRAAITLYHAVDYLRSNN